MKTLQELLKEKELEFQGKKFRSQRAELLGELYEGYKKDNKIQNWKNYISWLKKNHIKHSRDSISKFKKEKEYFKQMPIKTFAFFISHIPSNDLFYLVSIMKDKLNRKESFCKWLFYALKTKD